MLRALTLVCGLLALPALAETTSLTIAQDRYLTGASVSFDGPSVTDLFMAGNVVSVTAPIDGSRLRRRWRGIFSRWATASQ